MIDCEFEKPGTYGGDLSQDTLLERGKFIDALIGALDAGNQKEYSAILDDLGEELSRRILSQIVTDDIEASTATSARGAALYELSRMHAWRELYEIWNGEFSNIDRADADALRDAALDYLRYYHRSGYNDEGFDFESLAMGLIANHPSGSEGWHRGVAALSDCCSPAPRRLLLSMATDPSLGLFQRKSAAFSLASQSRFGPLPKTFRVPLRETLEQIIGEARTEGDARVEISATAGLLILLHLLGNGRWGRPDPSDHERKDAFATRLGDICFREDASDDERAAALLLLSEISSSMALNLSPSLAPACAETDGPQSLTTLAVHLLGQSTGGLSKLSHLLKLLQDNPDEFTDPAGFLRRTILACSRAAPGANPERVDAADYIAVVCMNMLVDRREGFDLDESLWPGITQTNRRPFNIIMTSIMERGRFRDLRMLGRLQAADLNESDALFVRIALAAIGDKKAQKEVMDFFKTATDSDELKMPAAKALASGGQDQVLRFLLDNDFERVNIRNVLGLDTPLAAEVLCRSLIYSSERKTLARSSGGRKKLIGIIERHAGHFVDLEFGRDMLRYARALKACPALRIRACLRFTPSVLTKLVEHRRSRETIGPDDRTACLLVCEPEADPEGAFFHQSRLIEDILDRSLRVHYHEVRGVIPLALRLAGIRRHFAEGADVILMGGHGNVGEATFGAWHNGPLKEFLLLDFGPPPPGARLSLRDRFLFNLVGKRKPLKDGGAFILDSCATGWGESEFDNMAGMLHSTIARNAFLFAPTNPSVPVELRWSEDGRLRGVGFAECARTYVIEPLVENLK